MKKSQNKSNRSDGRATGVTSRQSGRKITANCVLPAPDSELAISLIEGKDISDSSSNCVMAAIQQSLLDPEIKNRGMLGSLLVSLLWNDSSREVIRSNPSYLAVLDDLHTPMDLEGFLPHLPVSFVSKLISLIQSKKLLKLKP